MALDNAQFMSELSITDPPGTDPLSEGDDQIRTSKRTQQQSFPNVDAAVTLSTAQLNLAAIKDEANTFTARNTFIDRIFADLDIRAGDGLLAAPTYAFQNAITTGMYLPAVGALGFSVEGIQRLQLGAGVMLVGSNTIQAQNGAASAPAYAFAATADMGFFRVSATSIGFATGGVTKGFFSAGAWQIYQDGSGGNAALNFSRSNGVIQWNIQSEGTSGFQPDNLSFSRFDNTTGAFLDIPFALDTNGGIIMATLPSGPGGLASGRVYAKQSQSFIGTELVLGIAP